MASYQSTHRELSNEYQFDRVSMVLKNICVLVLRMKVSSALEGLNQMVNFIFMNYFKVFNIIFKK